jgi:3-phosphoinositide dependent protein kinase-1
MVVGKPPFRGETEYLTFQKTLSGEMRELPDDMDSAAKDLILRVLVRDPHQRLGSGETGHADLRAHAFFHGVDWDRVFDQQVLLPPCLASSPASKFGISEKGHLQVD